MFCLAVILGPAIATLFEYDLTRFPDCNTYLSLAHFDLAQNPVRCYRVIIPFAAALLNFLFGGIFSKLTPAYFTGNFSLPFSFFLINTMLTAWFGLLIYRLNRVCHISSVPALIGTLTMLTCRYTVYMAALPLVDSLFCVVIALTLLGIKEKNTKMLLWAIFLGPCAKESFIFIAPLIFFFSHLDKKKQLFYFLLSGILVFACRYVYSVYAHIPPSGWLAADMAHAPNLLYYLPKPFTFYTLNKILMNTGLWIMAPILVLIIKRGKTGNLFNSKDKFLAWFLVAVLVQMLLSGSVERMFYLAMPVICIVVGWSVGEIMKLYQGSGNNS